jgi:hypothetical protein
MKVAKELKIKVPFNPDPDITLDPKPEDFFIAWMRPIKREDQDRQNNQAIATVEYEEAKAALAVAKLTKPEPKPEQDAFDKAAAELAKILGIKAEDLPTTKVKPYDYIADKLVRVEGLEGDDEVCGDLSNPLNARAYVLNDARYYTAIAQATIKSINTIKTGN